MLYILHYIKAAPELTKPLQPIYNLLKDELLDYEIASCDATKLQVLKEPGRRPQTKSLIHCMLVRHPFCKFH